LLGFSFSFQPSTFSLSMIADWLEHSHYDACTMPLLEPAAALAALRPSSTDIARAPPNKFLHIYAVIEQKLCFKDV